MSWIEWSDKSFRGLDLTELEVDQAYFNITNHEPTNFYLYSLTSECVKCPFKKLKEIHKNNETIVKLEVARSMELRLFRKDHGQFVNPDVNSDGLYWSSQSDLGEFGVYDLILKESGANQFSVAKDPVNTNSSIIIVAFLLFCLYWISKFVNKIYISRRNPPIESSQEIPNIPNDDELEVPKVKKRLKSLDIFRGVAIVLMIFVNTGGGHYWWIEHATWNGLHVADLVFPWFLFIMGVCIPMSIKSMLNRQIPKVTIMRKIVKRSITLFFIGLCLNTTYGASFGNIRIPGVLQRFGIAYLVVSLIHLLLLTNNVTAETRCQQIFYDIRILWKQWIVFAGFIFVYLATIFLANAPDCDQGYLGPGGIHEYQEHFNCTGGVVGLIDRTILGSDHLYQRARIRAVYHTPYPFDPEGIFGCLLTCVQVFLGVQCGMTLLTYPGPKERLRRWISWGCGLMAATAILTLFSVEDGIIPINKNLWSLSYVTVTASLAFFLLSLIYFVVDIKSWGDDVWTIFLYPGMNAIILYVGHTVFHKMWPFHWSFQIMNTHFILLLENIYTVIIWILISHYLFYKQFFYSI